MKRKVYLLVAVVMALTLLLSPLGCAKEPVAPPEKPPVEKPPAEKPPEKPAEVYKIKLIYSYHPGDVRANLAEKFKELVEKKTDQIKIDTYPSSQLYPQKEEPHAVASGAVEMHSFASYAYMGVAPACSIGIIFGMWKSMDQWLPFWNDPNGGGIIKKQLNEAGIHALDATCSSQIYIADTNARRPLPTIPSHDGLKFRCPPALEPWGRALHTDPVSISIAEAFTAMQTGMVDGTHTGNIAIYSQNWWQVCPYTTRYGPLWVWSVDLFANLKWWDSLPDDMRNLLEECAQEAREWSDREDLANMDAEATEFLQEKLAENYLLLDVVDPKENQLWMDAVAEEFLKTYSPKWPAEFKAAAEKYSGFKI
ncbi:MAG: TRAP transporter substrate-binding protein [Chloroflexota bacterium]|nr:TRAP transporter substrate-binding protein [Chloroflexota bacterium]